MSLSRSPLSTTSGSMLLLHWNSLRSWVEEYARELAKTFPEKPCVNKISSCGFPARLSSLPGSVRRGNNACSLGLWDTGSLRTDSASLSSLESFIPLISYCHSCTLIMSSLMMFSFSISFPLVNSPTRNSWSSLQKSMNFSNTSISKSSFSICQFSFF